MGNIIIKAKKALRINLKSTNTNTNMNNKFNLFSVNAEKAANTFKIGAKIMSYVATIKMFVRVYELGSMSAAARRALASSACSSVSPSGR